MKWTAAVLVLGGLFASAASAQPVRKESDVAKQRAAVEAWTACIADENRDKVARTLTRDFTSREYRAEMLKLAKTRVSARCFSAMPGEYRRIELGGLPFAGGLAERLIEQDAVPLRERLTRAAGGRTPATHAPSDAIAMCTARAAPIQTAALFATRINSPEESNALAALTPTLQGCSADGRRLEATPLGMRSMLATATFRLLAAQDS